MNNFLLSEVDFACPICLERLKDPFVTQCGHSFCYSCIVTHLQNKSVCPCCSEYLTQDKVFPNYLLSKAVENAGRAKLRTEGTLVEQLHAAITSQDASLCLADVDALLETLEEKRNEMQKQKKENNLELLLHFLNHSKSSKAKKLVELHDELHILNKDIHHVETKQQKTLPAPESSFLALPSLPTLTSHTWLQIHMQPKGGGVFPSVTVEDVSAQHCTPSACGSQKRGQDSRGTLEGPQQSDASLQPPPSPGTGAAAPRSNLYQPNGQHLSTSVLGLDLSGAGRVSCDHSAQGGVGPSLSAGLMHPIRQKSEASNSKGKLLSSRPQSQPSSSLLAHSGTTPLPLPHSSGLGSSPVVSQLSSPPPWPPPQLAADQATRIATHAQRYSGLSLETATQAMTNEMSSGVVSESGTTITSKTTRSSSGPNKRPFESQYEDLQQHYLRMRQKQMGESKRRRQGEAGTPLLDPDPAGARKSPRLDARGPGKAPQQADGMRDPGSAAPVSSDDGEGGRGMEMGDLQEFSRMLSMTTRRSKLEVIASMPGASQQTSAAILSSVAFDKDAVNFATAGVSKRISVYNYAEAVATYGTGQTDEVDPTRAQLRSRSKLSCLSWSCFTESHLVSSDYEGVISLWDTHSLQPVTEYEAHNKRVWSVDFCPSNAQLLASGSDDGCVKIWAMNQSSSVAEIDLKANVCSVKYNPVNQHELAVGSADHNVLLFDTRRCGTPLRVFSGHKKAVSYVVYMNNKELISASTDSSLRLWSIGDGKAIRSYAGHVNEKNFVGLSAEGDFVACGSETSQIFVYYRAMSRPITRTLFSPGPSRSDAASRSNSQFISALCWKPQSEKKTLVAANSQGAIKILQLQC